MLTQAYYKGKQKSSAIPAYNTHTNGKLDAQAFYFLFLFSLYAALSSANSQHRKASALSRATPSPSINTHSTSSLKLSSPLTLTQVPLKLHCTNLSFQRKLTENQHEALCYTDTQFLCSHLCRKVPGKTLKSL